MYALSLGIQQIDRTLPSPVYALLSGLNASTVGIIALAAVQLAEKAIRDKISRVLVVFGACAGLCYSALWYFPVLMVGGGVATAVWDGWGYQFVLRGKRRLKGWWGRQRELRSEEEEEEGRGGGGGGLEAGSGSAGTVRIVDRETEMEMESVRMRRPDAVALPHRTSPDQDTNPHHNTQGPDSHVLRERTEETPDHAISVRTGIAIIVLFFGTPPKP